MVRQALTFHTAVNAQFEFQFGRRHVQVDTESRMARRRATTVGACDAASAGSGGCTHTAVPNSMAADRSFIVAALVPTESLAGGERLVADRANVGPTAGVQSRYIRSVPGGCGGG
ncbi:unnamed protein product [Coffea canephora]|uniref:Uncharacterized protein n=1 Tax=Coffea canephora TaxID=49390 RepID=A0A068TLT2_COFCA|nr:unnamed protein product [Coffea canephora]